MNPKKRNGITLVEFLLVIAILGILATLVLPSFVTLLERRRIQGAAESLIAQLVLARSHALATQSPVVVSYHTGGPQTWATGYRLHLPCDPTQTDVAHKQACMVEQSGKPVLTAVHASEWPGVSLSTNRPFTRIDGQRGLCLGSNATLILRGIQGVERRVIISTTCRIRETTP